MTKLLGIVVANGLSSENRVFATLLHHRADRYEAEAVVHRHRGDTSATRFGEIARLRPVPLDTGWRPNTWSRRGNPQRAVVAMRFRRKISAIVDLAERVDADLVYSSQQHYDVRAAAAVSDALGIPQIVHLHYTIGPWLRDAALERLTSARRVIAVSDFIRDLAIAHGVIADRVTTIHNAMDPFDEPDEQLVIERRNALGFRDDDFVFGMVGRLDPGKGHMDAVDAFERLAESHDRARLVIVGTGQLDRSLRSRVARSSAANRITLLGQRADVPDLLTAFDALVHPATADPCPLAVLEGMAAGLPVIGYADGGVRELVEDQSTGLLAPLDDLVALKAAMSMMCRNPTIADELGRAGRDRLRDRFDPRAAGASFAEIVDSTS